MVRFQLFDDIVTIFHCDWTEREQKSPERKESNFIIDITTILTKVRKYQVEMIGHFLVINYHFTE